MKITDNGYILEEDFDGEVETFDISDRILALSDELAEDIVLSSISDHINGKVPFVERMNYVKLFKNKIEELRSNPENEDLKLDMIRIITKVVELVQDGLTKVYHVNIGEDIDDKENAFEYLDKIETMYEFFFVRNYSNLFDLMYYNIIKNKNMFVDRYKEEYQESQEADLFITQNKKKFKNFDDAIIINYLIDIMADTQEMYKSGFELFKAIAGLDKYELYNSKMENLLFNYGEGLVVEDDYLASKSYFRILDDKEIFTNLRNDLIMKYLEGVAVDEEYGSN